MIEHRYEGNLDGRLPDLVAELVQLKVDVIVVEPLSAIRAAKQATKAIPIVMVTNVDPVATGLVDSLARPGGEHYRDQPPHPRIERKATGTA